MAKAKRTVFTEHGAGWIWPAALAGGPRREPRFIPGKGWLLLRFAEDLVNRYVEFRHEIDLPAGAAAGDAELTIIADSNYAAWLNGRFLGTGQFSNYPDRRTWDTIPVPAEALNKGGKNVLAILMRYNGEGFQSYIPGAPGLIYVLRCGKAAFVSGDGVQWRPSPCYPQGEVPKITRQLGWSWEYDARGEDGWRELDYKCGPEWSAITKADFSGPAALGEPIPRPVERLRIGERTAARVVAQGVFRRQPPAGAAGKPLAWLMQCDYLSARTDHEVFGVSPPLPLELTGNHAVKPVWREGDGVYFVIDLGREEAGVLELDLEADAGAVVDVAYGEHLEDLRVRAETGGRNFADRYTCKDGRQTYTHWLDRWAGRYLQLHVHGLKDRLILHYAGLRVTKYPLERRGSFNTPDELANRIYQTGVRTMELCTHERYEDCPAREQGLYENDARNQALCGYYCFGEYAFPRAAFDLCGRGWHEDGYLEMTAPSDLARTIPSFSMVWILALEDYYLHAGDAEYVRGQMPVADKMLSGWLATLKGGLMPSPKGRRFWHFYDWADGLDGNENFPGTSWILEEERFDAPLNFYLCMALRAAAGLAEACGDAKRAGQYRSAADEVRAAAHKRFFDAQRNAYRTYVLPSASLTSHASHDSHASAAPAKPGPRVGAFYDHADKRDKSDHFAELTQGLAILSQAAPEKVAGELRRKLAGGEHDWVRATFSQSIYMYQAILTDAQRHGPAVFRRIEQDWGRMLLAGATSFWEIPEGPRGGSSLCHGWSAVPVYFYQAYLLGVRPTAPGFAEFAVDPVTSAAPSAEGRVPTPHGPIELKWERAGDHVVYELKHPRGTRPSFPSAGENDVVKVQQV